MHVHLRAHAIELLFRDHFRVVDFGLHRFDGRREHERERAPGLYVRFVEALGLREHGDLRQVREETMRATHCGFVRFERQCDREQHDTRRGADAQLTRECLDEELRFEWPRSRERARDERRSLRARRRSPKPVDQRTNIRKRKRLARVPIVTLAENLFGRRTEIAETSRGLVHERIVRLAEPCRERTGERAPANAETRQVSQRNTHGRSKLSRVRRCFAQRRGDRSDLRVARARAPRRFERFAQSSELHARVVYRGRSRSRDGEANHGCAMIWRAHDETIRVAASKSVFG